MVFLQGGPIANEFVKILSAQTSSGTAEIVAQNQSVRMCMGVKNILCDPAMHVRWQAGGTPITIGDNQACIKACTTLGALSALTRHMERQLMFVREVICRALMIMIWWPTEDMMSDMITKSLAEPGFLRHRMEITGDGCATASENGRMQGDATYQPYENAAGGAVRFRRLQKSKPKTVNLVRTVAYLKVATEEIRQWAVHRMKSIRALNAEEQALIQMQRYGFPPTRLLKQMAKEQVVQGMSFPDSMVDNEVFLQKVKGRFRRQTHKQEISWDPGVRFWAPLFFVHCDALQLSVASPDGCKMAYCFYDKHCSRFRMVYPVSSKSLFWKVLQKMILRVRSYGRNVGILQTDGAAEMVGEKAQEILDLYGIRPLESSPYAPQENGAAESCVREIKDLARVLMANARHLPDQMGMEAVVHAANLLNLRAFKFYKKKA